jgi:hypothetical protein
MPRQRHISSSTSANRKQCALTKLYQGSLGMWSNLLVAFLMSMPALMYGTVLWLNYLQ